MTAPIEKRTSWSIEDAEQLLLSLKGVVSARLVTRPGGEVEEIHLLTTDEVAAKQTVRNVESALLAQLGIEVDHRKISVAQTKQRPAAPAPELPVRLLPEPLAAQNRLLFQAHQVETERSHQVKHRVEIEWKGARYSGTASAADLPRPRLEAVSKATLTAVEQALLTEMEGGPGHAVTLSLDGVKVVDAFDRTFVLVAVNAMSGRDVTPLAGATVVEVSPDRAAILATLQATDRWVRGRV
ncbi:MAG: hypothetical protein Q8P50_07530 [Bacillota bacterium]|nr:hypothetical protein [Bacillota bacterium]